MCGIAGYFGNVPVDNERLQRCLSLMNNRGPDHQNHVEFRSGNISGVLLHSRLAIIDLDARSNQPFSLMGCSLVFNGEIYNYLEVRQDLALQGVRFETDSDTEVLLRAYLRYGEACVERFEGMWAFAIFDSRSGKLFLSRDRFAEKPLYYMCDSAGFYFASEVKFLQALNDMPLEVNTDHILRYLVNGYKSLYKTRDTFFSGLNELPSATNLFVSVDLSPREVRYWNPQICEKPMSYGEAVEGVRAHLVESMRLRLRSDVPIAFCLSGGIDSSALASIAVKELGHDVAAYSILDRDERYNELENIRATVADLNCEHEIIEVPKGNFLKRFSELVRYHDAPIYTASYYVHAYLSEAISRAGCRVSISGTGADELVTGYYDHFNLFLHEIQDHPCYANERRSWETHVRPIVRNPHLRNPELYDEDRDFRTHIYLNNDAFADFLNVAFEEEFVEERYCESMLRNRMLNELFHESVPVILHEDDLNSMFYSVENRSPYLDSRLFEFTYSIPAEHLVRDGYAKAPLRDAVRGTLNDQVRCDRRKVGFNAAINSIVELRDPTVRDELMSENKIFDIVDRDKISRLLQKEDIPNSYAKFIFSFISTRCFLEAQA